jgi:hypothetical protein
VRSGSGSCILLGEAVFQSGLGEAVFQSGLGEAVFQSGLGDAPDELDEFSPAVAFDTTLSPPLEQALIVDFSITNGSPGFDLVVIAQVAKEGAGGGVFCLAVYGDGAHNFLVLKTIPCPGPWNVYKRPGGRT